MRLLPPPLFATLAIASGIGLAAGPGCVKAADAPAAVDEAASAPVPAPATVVIRGRRQSEVGPLPGLAVGIDQIPANVQSATARQLREQRALTIGDTMNRTMQGVSVNENAGNPFQADVNYRGFTASPQVGTPQGLAVFFDGVRVNEPFGDVVNWDLIPTNAIERFDLFPGSNPLFGLNTLGGAISVRSKSGFSAPGVEGSLLAGSFGRTRVEFSAGANDGRLGGFAALQVFDERGWRDDSPSQVRQFYGRADLEGEAASGGLALLAADNRLVGNGLVPSEDAARRRASVFTSPDESLNRLLQATAWASIDTAPAQSLVVRAYHRRSDRDGLGGDIYEGFDDFSGPFGDVGDFVDVGGRRITRNGAAQFLPSGALSAGATGYVDGTPIGLLTRTRLRQRASGLALQYNWNLARHKAMAGASYDRTRAGYRMTQRLGLIDAGRRVFAAPEAIDGNYYAAANDVPGNDFSGTQATASVYASETWSPRGNLHLTLAARYNDTRTDSTLYTRASAAQRDLHDLRNTTQGIDALVNARERTAEAFSYRSLNPSLGVNWLPVPELNLYASLSRGARVPSVVELGCAFDGMPVPVTVGGVPVGTVPRSLLGAGCSLPTALSGDPYLPQIRSLSGEIGGRGRLSEDWRWNAALHRTDLRDDIYFVGVGDGKSFFDTVGRTRRQGFELGVSGRAGPLEARADYSYTEATFESTFYVLSPHNSSADFDANSQAIGNRPELGSAGATLPSPTANANRGRGTYRMIRIDPGAQLPGVPRHAFNGSLTLQAGPRWRIGLGMQARSSSFVRGNENNLHQPSGTDQQTGQYYCPDENCIGGFVQEQVRPGRPFTNRGRVPGYTLFHLDVNWQLDERIGLFLQVTNLFDREYASAGRLGVNPFSPSGVGAIGPSGWNYNSAEWANTTYVAPGAPRGIWLGVQIDLEAP